MEQPRNVIGVVCLALVVVVGGCSTTKTAELSPPRETVNVPLPSWLATRHHAFPGSLETLTYTEFEAQSLLMALEELAAGRVPMSAQQLRDAGFEVLTLVDGSGTFAIVQDATLEGTRPTVVINTAWTRNIIVEVPHAAFERGTAEEAALVLTEIGGRAAILSGAHRCASGRHSMCSGKTGVCGGGKAPYPDSDVAHNPDTLFHLVHVKLTELWPQAMVLNLHGMRKDGLADVIVSDGSHRKVDGQASVANRLRDQLRNALGAGPGVVVSCNSVADEVFEFRKLCGFTNVQGRHLNRSRDVCNASTETSTNLFVHIEQSWDVLSEMMRGWSDVDRHRNLQGFLTAIEKTVPPERR